MRIETRWNIGDEVFLKEGKSIIKTTVNKVHVHSTYEQDGECTVTYDLRVNKSAWRNGILQKFLMSKEEAIREFEQIRSNEFLSLFG